MRTDVVRRSSAVLGFVVAWATVGSAAEDEAALPIAEEVVPALRPVIENALRQSPRVFLASLAKLQAEQQTLVTSSPLYPHLDANLSYDQQREERNAVWANGSRLIYSAGISYPLFNWGAVKAGVQIGKIQAEMAANNLQEAYQLAALEVRREYLQLILTKGSLQAARFRLDLEQRHLELVQTRVEAGELPSYSLSTTQNSFDDASLGFDRAQQGMDLAIKRFRRLAGLEELNADSIPDEIPRVTAAPKKEMVPLRTEFLADGGFEDKARFENKELEIRRERLNAAILRVNQRPMFDVRAGVSQDELARETDITRRSKLSAVGIGVRLRWNIFDGFASRGRLLSTRTNLRRLENDLQNVTSDLKEAAETAFSELDFAGRSLDVAERRFGPVPQNFRRAQEDFDSGLISEDDLNDAQSRLYSAQISVYSARAAYLNALATFLSSVNADPAVASRLGPSPGS